MKKSFGMINKLTAIVLAASCSLGAFSLQNEIETQAEDITATKSYIKGDLNYDGTLDVLDLSIMKEQLTNGFQSDLDKNVADVTADGIVDVEDVKMLQDYILKRITSFPETYYTQEIEVTTASTEPTTAITEIDTVEPTTELTTTVGATETTETTTTEATTTSTSYTDGRQMEYLDRGVSAVSTGSNVFVSWRSLATDASGMGFNVYRTTDGETVKVNDTVLYDGTNFTDTTADLSKDNTYTVKAVVAGEEIDTDGSDTLAANSTANCEIIPINEGSTIHFVWVGDFNGDGKYDYLVDRPTDDHQKLEAYLNDGTYLWTIDLGYNSENKNNISPGASTIDVGMWDGATVYDIDCDGYAEVLLRIADGVTFGDGTVYSNDITNGQAIAVINGQTGALETSAPVPDDYISIGPMACMMEVGYLDGKTPSLITWLKNRNSDKSFNSLTCAYTFTDGEFALQWKYDNKSGYAEAHQIRVVDVDSDGKDEVLHMGYALNNDGSLRYHMDDVVHGDRWFVGAFDNASNGGDMVGYGIQQENESGLLEYFYNASTGVIYWTNQTTDGTTYDVGRGNVGDIDPNYSGFECFSFQGTWTNTGTKICDEYEYPCIRLWWDGDLLSEQYNDTKIEEWNYTNKSTDRLLSTWKITDCVGSDRGAPMFYGDIMGDWREEVIMTSSDYSKLVIFQTTDETDTRLYSLSQNPCYRNCMTAKGYYQSHMLDYYLGTGMETPTLPDISIISKKAD